MQPIAASMGDWVLLPYIAFALFAILGVAIHRWRASSWKLVEGRIDKIEFGLFGDQTTRGSWRDKRGARIEYSFSVEGERYGGYFGLVGFPSDAEIEEYLKRTPPGAVIFIRFSAKNPDESEGRMADNPRLDPGIPGVHAAFHNMTAPDLIGSL